MSDLVRLLSLAAAFFVVAVLVIAFGVGRNCFRSASEADITEQIRDIPPTFEMRARDLVEEYLADEAAAASAYNGKVGIVTGIEPSDMISPGGSVRTLPRGPNWIRLHANGVWEVRCFFSDEEKNKLRDPWEGSRKSHVLKGRVEGINDKHLTIDLRGCIVHY